jgi:putative transposon-encoded protein
MAKQIFPGVYVLDVPQTPEYRQSKAGKYTDIYTNQRYENWQTSLKLAEANYKSQYDAYTANAKATKELVDDIDRQLSEQRRIGLSLEKDVLTNSEKTKQYMAAKQTDRARFVATQTEANRRAASRDKAISGQTYVTADQDRKLVDQIVDQAVAAYDGPNSWDNVRAISNGISSRKDATSNGPEDLRTVDRAILEGIAAKKQVKPSEIISAAPDDMAARYADSLTVGTNKVSAGSGTGSPSGGGKGYGIFSPDIDPEQANRISQLEEMRGTDYARTVAKNVLGIDWKPGVVRGGEGYVIGSVNELGTKRLMSTSPSVDLPDASTIIDNARNIYGSKFESLPNYEKKKSLGDVKSYIDTFINWKLSKLPADANPGQVAQAKAEAVNEAIFFAKNGKLIDRSAETTDVGLAISPTVDAAGTQAMRDIPSLSNTVSSAPVSKAATALGLQAAAKDIQPLPEDKVMRVGKEEIDRIMSGRPKKVPEDDIQFGESVPVVDPAFSDKDMPASTVAKKVVEKVAPKSIKEEDFTHALKEQAEGRSLLDKPKKAERLLSNTSIGKTVTDLWNSNDHLDQPKDWIGLRATVIETYKGDEKSRDQALRLLAYRFQLQDRSDKAIPQAPVLKK